ncbi:MAG: pyridoxamine 5'-phosphate oxidase family protein [Thermomicrobiaceae bacterium]
MEQRTSDVLSMLRQEVDAWVASASEDGDAYLVPLSFAWTGEQIIMATPVDSITSRNLKRAGRARIAIGPTRDVVIVEGSVDHKTPPGECELWDIHSAATGFDARSARSPFALLVLAPELIQAWRNPAELTGRDVMRRGRWLAQQD